MKRLLSALALILLTAALARATCDGTTTTNLGVCKPNHGAYNNNWETVLNPNYDLLDFSFVSPLSRSGTAVSLGTVPYSKGGTGQTTNTKGDLLVGTGSGWSKLAVGANGTAIIADSAQTTGVKWAVAGSGSSLPVTDSTSIAKGSTDPTKKVRFEVDGLTTGTTRVITVPDADITLSGGGCTQLMGSTGTERVSAGGGRYMVLGGIGSTVTSGDHFDYAMPISDTSYFSTLKCTALTAPGPTSGDGYDIKIYEDGHGAYANPVCQLRGSTLTCTGAVDSSNITGGLSVEYYIATVGSANTIGISCGVKLCH